MREHFYIPSGDGKTRLHCVWWRTEKEPAAVLQITHGMMEHILRYDELAQFLSEKGIAVIGHDHLGHGRSCADQELGFFADDKGYILLIKDIYRVTKAVKKRYPDIPCFIMGHSMGSFLLRRYLTLYGEETDGAIIMGTGDQPLPLLMTGGLLTRIVSCFRGPKYRSRLIHQIVLGRYNLSFKPNRTANDWLSEVDEKVDSYCQDPYCNFYFTCSAYQDFFRILKDLKRKKQSYDIPIDLPVLFVSGAKDPVGDFGKGVMDVYTRYKRRGMKDVILKLYPKARHEIINASNREEIYGDIAYWIFSHIYPFKQP